MKNSLHAWLSIFLVKSRGGKQIHVYIRFFYVKNFKTRVVNPCLKNNRIPYFFYDYLLFYFFFESTSFYFNHQFYIQNFQVFVLYFQT